MQCEVVQKWLMQSQKESEAIDPPIAKHLRTCTACAKLAQRVQSLDSLVRNVPTPRSAVVSRDRFLKTIKPTVPSRTHRPSRRNRIPAFAWIVAASFLLAVSIVTFFVSTPKPAMAKTKVLDELVELNIALGDTSDKAERQTLINKKGPALRRAAANLSIKERDVANRLLDSADALAASNDPLEDAEHFHAMADSLAGLLQDSTEGPELRLEEMAKLYARVDDRVDSNIAKVSATKDQTKQLRVKDLNTKQTVRVEALTKKLPESARKHVVNKKK